MQTSLRAPTQGAVRAEPCRRCARNSSAKIGALVALTSFAVLDRPEAAQLDPADVMIQEYQSFCLDYYTSSQCAGAIRFILGTSGKIYFEYLSDDQSMDGFLDRLASAVRSGEGLLAKEALAIKTEN